jgi:hypothetical protein
MSAISLKTYFQYNPVKTERRKACHEMINEKALELAQTIQDCVQDPKCQEMAIFAVQQARMFANQGATIDELKKSSLSSFPNN